MKHFIQGEHLGLGTISTAISTAFIRAEDQGENIPRQASAVVGCGFKQK